MSTTLQLLEEKKKKDTEFKKKKKSILNGELLKASLLIEQRRLMATIISVSITLDILISAMKQEKEIKNIRAGKGRVYLFI